MSSNVDYAEYASGFRHDEVISFINNEVLSNGGGPDFYTTFRSQSWSEIEDRLQAVLNDPELPSTIKRACTWSALTLGIRVGARQREQLVYQVRQLQDRVEELEGASWALAPELQRLRKERDEMALQLRFTQAAQQQALNERDMLHGWLLQTETLAKETLLAHGIVPGPRPVQVGAMVWPLSEEQHRNMGAMGMPGCLWGQAMQPLLPLPCPFPFYPPFPMGFPPLQPLPPPPPVFTEAVQAVIPPNMPSLGNNPPGPQAIVGTHEEMAPLGKQRSHSHKEGPEILQDTVPLWNINSLSQQDPERPQGMVNLSDNKNHSQEDGAVGPQGMVPTGYSYNQSQEQHLERPHSMVTMGDRNKSHSQEKDPEMPQGTVPLGGIQSQEGDPERPQATHLRGSSSLDVKQNPKKQRPQGQRFWQSKERRASASQLRKMSARRDWDCPWCKMMNFSWRKACFRCRIVYIPGELGNVNPGQTH
ncbi:testis-expressed protein 13D [Phyllostomus hastatus]|uniref:testis-expressed protein 13D n=1 Tax=Phyllostomus hastatus TaxID=9423 RepID=UPI001E684E1A|nr:testis-expressed protein 13D [Phyllostomus hastatus]